MKRAAILFYGVFAYAVGMGSLVYMMGWLGNIGMLRSIDSSPTVPLGRAMIVNAAVFLIFCLQHSVMARPKFKAWWTQFIPNAIERSTYVLLSGVALFAVMLFWEPMGGVVWVTSESTATAMLYTLYAIGWAILVGSTFALNHFDLFGLRQVWLAFRGNEYTPLEFATPGPYRHVRHPLYIGWITLAWATPIMTSPHLAFAIATTVYILVAIQFEERDLVTHFGEKYVAYRKATPMLIPRWSSSQNAETPNSVPRPATQE